MGAFVGALFPRNTNKTNNKQHLNRGYDSESGHHYLEEPAYGLVFCFWETGLSIELRSYSPQAAFRLLTNLKKNAGGPLSFRGEG